MVAWQRVAIVLGLPLELKLGRDAVEEPVDAGHLPVQEPMLRVGRTAGYRRTFRAAHEPADPSRSTDVGLIDDSARRLVQIECVNTSAMSIHRSAPRTASASRRRRWRSQSAARRFALIKRKFKG